MLSMPKSKTTSLIGGNVYKFIDYRNPFHDGFDLDALIDISWHQDNLIATPPLKLLGAKTKETNTLIIGI